MCHQFPKYFFSSEVWQIFVQWTGFFWQKYSFLFSAVKILLKFPKREHWQVRYQWNKLKTRLKSNILEHLTYNQNVKLTNLRIRTSQMVHFWRQKKVSMVRVWFSKERKFHIVKCKTKGLGPTFPLQSKVTSIPHEWV